MIYILKDKIKVQEYQKVLKVNENEVSFQIHKKNVFIYGKNLFIEYFDGDEFCVNGTFLNIKFE